MRGRAPAAPRGAANNSSLRATPGGGRHATASLCPDSAAQQRGSPVVLRPALPPIASRGHSGSSAAGSGSLSAAARPRLAAPAGDPDAVERMRSAVGSAASSDTPLMSPAGNVALPQHEALPGTIVDEQEVIQRATTRPSTRQEVDRPPAAQPPPQGAPAPSGPIPGGRLAAPRAMSAMLSGAARALLASSGGGGGGARRMMMRPTSSGAEPSSPSGTSQGSPVVRRSPEPSPAKLSGGGAAQ